MMKLYNTLSRQKEPLPVSDHNTVRIYTCGPTVYNFAHIGNFRTYVFEDVLIRAIKHFGQSVLHVMNITDVDDKTIKGALEKKVSLEAFTQPYRDAFFEDLATLNCIQADRTPSAVAHIPDMIALIQDLIEKQMAYQGDDGSVYFSTSAFKEYGKLSHLCLKDLQTGASERVDSDEYDKATASDFVLWKGYDKARDGEIFWESPFGKGRPGWHIECSAMALKELGPNIDIHCGGVDNIFPHHENEIAQSEAHTGCTFAKLWMHAEHLLVDGKKMSKSAGNFYTLRDLLEEGFTGEEVRFLLLGTHYKTQLNFTKEGLFAARASLQRVQDCINRVSDADETDHDNSDLFKRALNRFDDALADDLNVSEALATVFDTIREINTLIDENTLGKKDVIMKYFKTMNSVIGAFPTEPQKVDVPKHIQEALDKRDAARKAKNWVEADAMRDLIQDEGYTIIDTPKGPQAVKQ